MTTTTKKTNKASLLKKAMRAVQNDEMVGYCLACGAEADCIEPDARKYKCESCEALKVYGAEELVLMLSMLA